MTVSYESIIWKKHTLDMAIHPYKNGIICLYYPGFNEGINGEDKNYVKFANFLQSKKFGTIIRIGNTQTNLNNYQVQILFKLESLLDFSIENSSVLSGKSEPEIYIVGYSAGGSSVAALSNYSTLIKKILLISPSFDVGKKLTLDGISNFHGELSITMGLEDKIIAPRVSDEIFEKAKKTKHKQKIGIPGCDHLFTGEKMSQIFSKAPLWAFLEDNSFPNSKGGIDLGK